MEGWKDGNRMMNRNTVKYGSDGTVECTKVTMGTRFLAEG